MRARHFTTTALAAIWLMAAGASQAQTAAPVAASEPDSGQLDEIVVTSRKVSERLQDVPLSISAFSAADLVRRGIREPSDLSGVVPGLNFEKDFGRRMDRPVIRGQSNVLGVPNVSFFIDGVFIPDSLFSTDLAFVDRVEVIKGPQSALYGRQSFAGAVSYINKVPTNEWERTIRLTGGSYGYGDVLGTVSGPLIKDKLGVQLAANYYSFDGEYRNNAPADSSNRVRVGSEETAAASIALRYTGIQHLDLTFRASHSENDDGPEAIGMQVGAADNCYLGTRTRYYCGEIHVTPADIHANESQVSGGEIARRVSRSSLTANYDLGGYTLTSVSGFNRAYESRKADLDYLPVRVSNLNVDDAVITQSESQELRITSPSTGKFQWLVGGYFYRSTVHSKRYFFNTGVQQDNGVTKTTNYAGFGLVRYHFTPQLSASAELRVGQDDLRLVGGSNRYNLSAGYTSTNPRFTIDYKLLPSILVYGSAARGNKPGGFNTDVRLQAADRTYGEETSWEYELGAKTEFFDHRVRVNGAIYHIDWKGQQLTQSTVLAGPPVSTVSFIRNVGNLDVDGAEFDGQAVLTPNVIVRATASYAKSRYTSGYDPDSFTLTGNGDITGKTSPNAPRTQYSFGVNAWRTVLNHRVFIDADYVFRSRKYDQLANLAYVQGRAVADVRLGVDVGKGTVTAFVTNLFDNIDPVSVTRYSDFSTPGPYRSFLGSIPPGRRFGLSYEAKF